ncbi:MAG: chemotaxis protein, partial [Hyphomicrobiales bacterium]
SAGCSNGHEPYSIALTILSMMPDAAERDIKILASDIDPNVVAFGRAGIYDENALEPVPRPMQQRWFRPAQGGLEVTDPMRELVSFRELNLIGAWPMRGGFDAIFCRNVTIYFDQPTREKIWHRFCQQLHPQGFLFMGHSERLTGAATKHLVYEGTTSYRRLEGEVA